MDFGKLLEKRRRKPGEGMFRLSSLGYCPRRIALSRWIGYELPRRQLVSTMIGEAVHERVGRELGLTDREKEVYLITPDGFRIPGHIDGMLDGELVEMKVSYWGRIDDSPFTDAYMTQIMLYAQALGLRGGWLLVIGKDGRLDWRFIELDESRVKKVLDSVDELIQVLPWEELPDPRPSKECMWCPFTDVCGAVFSGGRWKVEGDVRVFPILEEVIHARTGSYDGKEIRGIVSVQEIHEDDGRITWAGPARPTPPT